MEGLYTNNNYVQASMMGQIATCSETETMMSSGKDKVSSVCGPETGYSYPPQPGVNCYFGLGGNTGGSLQSGVVNPLNYIPSHSSIMTTLSSIAPASSGLGVTAPGSFTFTSPTRHSYISTPQIHSHPYCLSSASTLSSRTLTPGLGVSWQHTIPQQMPWNKNRSTAELPLFTAGCTYQIEPKPSCSTPPRRPKRHATEYGSEIPCKVYIGEEKMMASMKELTLKGDQDETMSTPMPNDSFTGNINTDDSSSDTLISRSWHKFKELEDMLLVDDGSSLTGEVQPPRIHLSATINRDLLSNNPLIPRKILDELNKPCMQIILWKPPGDQLLKDLMLDIQRKDPHGRLDEKQGKEEKEHCVQSLSDLCSMSATGPPPSSQQLSIVEVNYPDVDTDIVDDEMEL